MHRVGFGLFLSIVTVGRLFAGESFITDEEYAKMLYKNPRGISCAKCHGEHGEGKVLSTYVSGGKTYRVTAPPIYNISMQRFKRALKHRGKLMPQYFLTEWEMAHLYYYLLTQNPKYQRKKDKQNGS